jgi:hypothetical protein
MSLVKFGINREDDKRRTELIDWGNGDLEGSNSYIIADNSNGSIIGLFDFRDTIKTDDENWADTNILNKGICIRLNYNGHTAIGGKRLITEVHGKFTDENIPEVDLVQVVKNLIDTEFAEHKEALKNTISCRSKLTRTLVADPNSSWRRETDFDIYVIRNFNYQKENIQLMFEDSININRLTPIESKFKEGFKVWMKSLIGNINSVLEFSDENANTINFLLNKTETDNIQIVMSKSTIGKMNMIFNRINMEKAELALVEEKDTIDNIADLMKDIQKNMYDNYQNSYDKYGSPKNNNLDWSEFGVSIKGVSFNINKDTLKINLLDNAIHVFKSNNNYSPIITDQNKEVLNRALAYIVSLGNEHEQLEAKLEGKLLTMM